MQILRAALSGIIAAAGSLGTAATDGHISLAEGLVAVGATAAAVATALGVEVVAANRAARIK